MTSNKEQERREYFRIDDVVFLTFNIIPIEEFNDGPATLENIENNAFSMSADFASLNNGIHPLLNNIKQMHPDIGEYLDFLNQKIDSLNHLWLVKETDFSEEATIPANLSASGISFHTDEKIEKDQHVKIELILLPEKIGLLVFGTVVDVKEEKETVNRRISVKYEHIRQEDQELLIKHNLNKQITDLRVKNDFT